MFEFFSGVNPIFIAVFDILVILGCVIVFNRSMHMFQLNSYRTDTHLKWLFRNLWKPYIGTGEIKKPLVHTHRVIRMDITSIVLTIIFLLVTICTGRWYVFIALIVIAPFLPVISNITNTPIEKINNRRYINDAKRIINSMPNLITIAVTGSYGKTSTKYYLQKLLSAKYNVLMTPESYNTTLGVVKTVRGSLKPTHEIFICEMGMKWKGDIAEICEIVKPKHAVITSIGPQHLESMKTIEAIIDEKFSVAKYITNGMVFLNYDNEYIANRKLDRDKNVVKYGVSEKARDYRSVDISVSEKGSVFTVNAPDAFIFETSLVGEHNVQNIVGAIAVAHTLGVDMNELFIPVKRLECAPHRLEIRANGINTIIDDSFNSNPIGAKAALDVLSLFKGVKIIITPGMVELGDESYSLNKAFGAQAAKVCDYAILIGEKQAPPIKDGLLEAGFPVERLKVFNTFNEGIKFANTIPINSAEGGENNKRVILIENDLPDNY